jgi:hypothetical protein
MESPASAARHAAAEAQTLVAARAPRPGPITFGGQRAGDGGGAGAAAGSWSAHWSIAQRRRRAGPTAPAPRAANAPGPP